MRPSELITALLLPIALIAPPAAAQAPAQGTVQGTVSYDAESVAMRQVYARETRGSGSTDKPPQVLVLITDQPAPAKVIASRQAYYAAARDGEVRGLLLTLEDATSASMAIFARGGAYDDAFVPDVFDKIQLTDLKREGDTVSGWLHTLEPRAFTRDAESAATPTRYAIDLHFRVPVAPAPQPKQVLTGDAARNSEQVIVGAHLAQLLRTGTVAQIKAEMVPDHPLRQELDSPRAQTVLAIARKLLPPPATFRQSIERVIVYDDEAIVVARDKDGATRISLRRDGDTWKLAPAALPND